MQHPVDDVMRRLTADSTLEAAFEWLCRQRKEHSPNSSVWDLRSRWPSMKLQLKQQLRDGNFNISPTVTFVDAKGERREMREALDALTCFHFGYSARMRIKLGPARSAWANFLEKCHGLYEQGAGCQRLSDYIQRWVRWLHAGLTQSTGLFPLSVPR